MKQCRDCSETIIEGHTCAACLELEFKRDQEILKLRQQLIEKDATIKRLEIALFTHQSYDKAVCELQEENERLRKALEEARAEYSKDGTDIQVLRRMIKIVDAALGEGDKE